MKPTNIETSYGKFSTLIHFEKFWKKKVIKAFTDGFTEGYKYMEDTKR